ncbi:MAG TPA: IclR family transcriptional regulator [Pseudonocardiaceae bacterium]
MSETVGRGDRSGPEAAGQSAGQSAGSRIAVIAKAVRVLDAVADTPHGMTPSELAAAIGTNRSTAFRLLTSLESSGGLLRRDPVSGRYRLGLKLLRYGEVVRGGVGIIGVAEPAMRALGEQLRQTVYLSIRDGWGATCLHRMSGPEVDVLAWKTGQWLPLHVGAGPLALLAALPDREVERYLMLGPERQTRHGIVTPQEIRVEVGLIRRRGWSLNREALTEGVASLGVVVRDRTDAPICALSVAGLESRYRGKELDRTAATVVDAAAELGRRITGR